MTRIRSVNLYNIGLMAVMLFVVGCAGHSRFVPRDHFVAFTPEQAQEIDDQETAAYRIQEGDILSVAFPYSKELSQHNIVVLPDGRVSLIGLDAVKVAGLTLEQADSIVTAAYAKDYKNPQLTIVVSETRGRKVYVLGEVENPGLHTLPYGGLDMIAAVAVAGGFTDYAASSGAVLVRVTPEGYLVREVDLSGFNSPEYGALATVGLQPLDIVYVPRSKIGDFAHFSKTILSGILNMTRIAADVRYLSADSIGRY